MNVIDEIIDAVNNSKSIAILYHVNADGDAVGAGLALFNVFECLNIPVQIFGEEEVPRNLAFLPNSDKVFVGSTDKVFDLTICVDCGDYKRLGKRIEIFNNSKFTINIDHHIENKINANINFVDEKASSTCELVYDVLRYWNCDINYNSALSLCTGITTDTGGFRFSNTTAKVHDIAKELILIGVDPYYITCNVFENNPLQRLKVLAKVLDSIELFLDGKVATMYLDYEYINALKITRDNFENVANYGLSIEGVELSIFLEGLQNGKTKISLRSKSRFDCSKIARKFDGGGHISASGCEMDLSIVEAKSRLLEEVENIKI